MSVTSGWGRLTWDQANWGDAVTLKTGWGAQSWDGSGGWGDLADQTVTLDGQAATTSLGSTTVEINFSGELSGQEATSSVGSVSTRSDATFTLSGQAATSSVGSVVTEVAYDITTAGVATTSVGSVVTEVAYLASTGNRPQDNMRGVTGDLDIEIGQVLDSQVATFATPVLEYAGTLVGWGREGWGELQWGDSTNKVVNLVGLQADVSLGQVTEIVSLELNGQEATTNVGSVNFVISPTQVLDGQEATASQGDPTLEFAYTLSGQSSTSAVGTPTLEFAYELDGQSSTVSLGTIEVGSAELVDITGVSATSFVGSISPTEMTVGLSGQSATGATGSFDIADVVQGLVTDASTGQLGILGIQHFQDVPTGSNTSYSDVAAGANSSIAAVDTGSNTSYSDASTGSNSSISDVATGSNTSYTDAA